MRGSLGALILLSFISFASPAKATTIDLPEVLGMNAGIDRAADRAQALIDQARSAMFALEQKASDEANARLLQLDTIIKEFVRDVNDLQEKTFESLNALIVKFTAQVQALLDETLDRVFAQIGQLKRVIEESLGGIVKAYSAVTRLFYQ